jgi:hypothetical protein
VRAAILHGIEILDQFPNAGQRQHAEGIRKLVIRPYPYLVYYTADSAKGEACSPGSGIRGRVAIAAETMKSVKDIVGFVRR